MERHTQTSWEVEILTLEQKQELKNGTEKRYKTKQSAKLNTVLVSFSSWSFQTLLSPDDTQYCRHDLCPPDLAAFQ